MEDQQSKKVNLRCPIPLGEVDIAMFHTLRHRGLTEMRSRETVEDKHMAGEIDNFRHEKHDESTAASLRRASPLKTSPPKPTFPALGRPSPAKPSSTKTSPQKPTSSPYFLKAGSRTRAQTVGKAAGTFDNSNLFNIKRKPVPSPATISYGSPINLAAVNTTLWQPSNTSPSRGHCKKSRATGLTESKRLQLRSKTSATQLVEKDIRTVRESPSVSPATKSLTAKASPSPRRRGFGTDPSASFPRLSFAVGLRRTLPARGSIIETSDDGQHTIFDEILSPVHPAPPTPPPACAGSPAVSEPSVKEESQFSDWEIIDWPWVTPYAPAPGLAVAFGPSRTSASYQGESHHQPFDRQYRGGKKHNRARPQKRKLWENNYLAGETPVPHSTASSEGLTRFPFQAGGGVFEDDTKSDTRSVLCYKVSARRHGSELSQSSKAVKQDPAILACGPSHPNVKKTVTLSEPDVKSDSENVRKEGTQKRLENNLVEFAKAVSHMKKGDRRLIENFLEALRNVGEKDDGSSETELPNKPVEGEIVSSLVVKPRTVSESGDQKKLNPTAPDFSLPSKAAKQEITATVQEILPPKPIAVAEAVERVNVSTAVPIMPLQERPASNWSSKPLQETRPAKQNSGLVLVVPKQHNGSENRRMSKSDNTDLASGNKVVIRTRKSSAGNQGFPKHLGEPIWIKTLVSTAKKLERVAKQQAIELPSQMDIKANTKAIPLIPVLPFIPPVLVPVVPQEKRDLFHNDTGSGREAKVMDPSWAELRLKVFKEKYPLTGTKADDVQPMSLEEIQQKYPVEGTGEIPVCKKMASDIQQKLEMILYHQKEKKALTKLTEELAMNPHFGWL